MVDIFRCTPVRACNAFQNLEINSLSLLEMSSSSKLFSQYHSLKNMSASFGAMMSVLVRIRRTSDPSLSINIKMQLYPLSSGRGLTKSRHTESPHDSGIGSGWRGPFAFDVPLLLHWHSMQAGTYATSKSLCILGQ